MEQERLIVIGAGPVGLAAALMFSKMGFEDITVYEGRKEIPNDPEESYPIGINPRALSCFRRIEEKLEQDAIASGIIVNAWVIYGGDSKVAEQKSGTVYGTTRGDINHILFERAKNKKNIKIIFSHRLKSINFEKKSLVFTNTSSNEEVTVDASSSRIIAADGVGSQVRKQMQLNLSGTFESSMVPWTSEHRVLFGPIGAPTPPGLDPLSHYIFNGNYAAVVKRGDKEQWTLVMGALDRDPDKETKALMIATEATPENIKALKDNIARKSKLMLPLFENNEDELKKFFTRRQYRGAVVTVSTLNHEEWIVLLGDAAHSVLPPTGEGINSGLEDVEVLADAWIKATASASSSSSSSSSSESVAGKAMNTSSSSPAHESKVDDEENQLHANVRKTTKWFQTFTDMRMRDVHGLGKIALYLNENNSKTGPSLGARIGFMIFTSILVNCGIFKWTHEELMFGAKAVDRTPYGDIADMWEGRKKCLLPLCACCCFPMAYLWKLITLPFWLPFAIYRLLMCRGGDEVKPNSPPLLKPPVGDP